MFVSTNTSNGRCNNKLHAPPQFQLQPPPVRSNGYYNNSNIVDIFLGSASFFTVPLVSISLSLF